MRKNQDRMEMTSMMTCAPNFPSGLEIDLNDIPGFPGKPRPEAVAEKPKGRTSLQHAQFRAAVRSAAKAVRSLLDPIHRSEDVDEALLRLYNAHKVSAAASAARAWRAEVEDDQD